MWKYKFVLVETGMVRTVRYILLIRSIFLFVSSKLSLCGFGLDCEIGLRDQRSCFSFFFWDFADFKRIQIEPYSRKDHLEIILTNEKTNWPIVEQEQFQQKRFLLITRGQAQDNATVNPQATRLISRQLLKQFNVNFDLIVWIVTMTSFSVRKLKNWYAHRQFDNMSFWACWLKVTSLS